MQKKYYAIQQAARQADIYIFGDITSYPWTESDVSAFNIVQDIKGLDVDTINVYINSYGGEVPEGWAIYNTLRQHPAHVVTHGVGFVASAALYPFMAGDERFAYTTSAYYFHNVMFGASGYAEDLRRAADEAEKLTEIGRSAFLENTPLTEESLKELMDGETWLSPSEVFDRGIATALVAEKQMAAASQSVRQAVMQRLLQKTSEAPAPAAPPKKAAPTPETKPTANIMQLLAGLA